MLLSVGLAVPVPAADNVCKADKRSAPNVLHNVSLTVKEGKKTAIVGHFGSGKSTIANLIACNLAALRHADQILVIENGSIVRCGRHDSLIGEDGRYKELREMSKN